MVGNVYVQFREEDQAQNELQNLVGRYYETRPIIADFSPVTDFREATCRQYEENVCNRGAYCNFMHLKKISRELDISCSRGVPVGMNVVEAEAIVPVIVSMRSVILLPMAEGVITVTMIKAEDLEAEVQVEGVAEAEVPVEGETGVLSGKPEKAVLREGPKLSSGIRKGRMLNLVEVVIVILMMVLTKAPDILMSVPTITISIHRSKEMEIMTSKSYAVISVGIIHHFLPFLLPKNSSWLRGIAKYTG